jgi:hypothetical protein
MACQVQRCFGFHDRRFASSTPGRPRSRAVRISAAAPSGQRVSANAASNRSAAPPSATRHPSADLDREIDDLTLAARSMNTDENEDRRPSNRRTSAVNAIGFKPCDDHVANLVRAEPGASIACPPSRAIAAAALAAHRHRR